MIDTAVLMMVTLHWPSICRCTCVQGEDKSSPLHKSRIHSPHGVTAAHQGQSLTGMFIVFAFKNASPLLDKHEEHLACTIIAVCVGFPGRSLAAWHNL